MRSEQTQALGTGQAFASIGTISPSNSKRSFELELEKETQDLFSKLLVENDKTGFVSASSIETPVNQESVRANWNTWYDHFAPTRYNDYTTPTEDSLVREPIPTEKLRDDYGSILTRAYQEGGYATPESFLRRLSADELTIVQRIHRLADPIDVSKLSGEAALNLLIPPPAQIDQNRDGLTQVGAAYTLRFPDSTTPAEIRQAWEETTANLPEEDVALFTLQMKLPVVLANIHFDSSGNYAGSSEPGDSDWFNPMSSSSFSFREMAKSWLTYLEDFRPQIPAEQFDRDSRFWQTFLSNLEN